MHPSGRSRDRAYTLVTHDADFADFAAVYGAPPKVARLRTGNVPTAAIAELLATHATAITQFGADPELACLVLP